MVDKLLHQPLSGSGANSEAPQRHKIHYMVVGNKELKVPVNRNLLKMRSGLLQRTENLQSPCGCVIDGQVIRTASSSFDPSAKTPVCRLPLSRLNWMWRIDLPRLLMLNSQLHRSCLYSGTVERK